MIKDEVAIRAIVKASVESYASGFETRHIAEYDDPNGTINMKIHNIFIAALGPEIQYYTALVRSLDSSLGNMLEKMAINIAQLFYEVSQSVTGELYPSQTAKIAELLEAYKSRRQKPQISDYKNFVKLSRDDAREKTHVSDYYLVDKDTDEHYLIELKTGGDLDNKKARSEKEAILEQYAILSNQLGDGNKIHIYFATAYNRFGEGKPWKQERVKQFFATNELLIGKDFWNFVCKSEQGYEIVIDEYKKHADLILDALNNIKRKYLG
jgi:hypothetical protein